MVCKSGNVYGYKINIKVSGKIKGATSETQHTSTQLWLKSTREKNRYTKIIKQKAQFLTPTGHLNRPVKQFIRIG